jgi:hypothetical protein
LGKPGDTGDLEIEGGGELKTVHDWVRKNGGWIPQEDELSPATLNGASHSSTPSSDLSSVGDGLDRSVLPEPATVIKREGSDLSNGILDKKNGLPEAGPEKEAVKAADDAMDLT